MIEHNHNSVYSLPEETLEETEEKLRLFIETIIGIAGHGRRARHKEQIERLENKRRQLLNEKGE